MIENRKTVLYTIIWHALQKQTFAETCKLYTLKIGYVELPKYP